MAKLTPWDYICKKTRCRLYLKPFNMRRATIFMHTVIPVNISPVPNCVFSSNNLLFREDENNKSMWGKDGLRLTWSEDRSRSSQGHISHRTRCLYRSNTMVNITLLYMIRYKVMQENWRMTSGSCDLVKVAGQQCHMDLWIYYLAKGS